MKEHIKIRRVQGTEEKLDKNTLPQTGRLIMLGIKKRDSMPAARFYAPMVHVGNGVVRFAMGDITKGGFRMVDGDVWFNIPVNPNYGSAEVAYRAVDEIIAKELHAAESELAANDNPTA